MISETKSKIFENRVAQISIVFLFFSLLYQPVLCFLNTHVLQVSITTVALAELLMLSVVMLLFFQRIHQTLLILLVFVFANALILVLFQNFFNPKEIRNILIPIIALWLGLNYRPKIPVDTLVVYMALLVIIVGIFEAIFPKVYQSLFDVLHYQIAMGRATESVLQYTNNNFSLNGVRFGGRNLLSFLGDHRISSVFLETVNMGNFSVILAAWGLAKNDLRKLCKFLVMALIIALLADSRFGITIISLMMLLRIFLPNYLLKPLAYCMPILIIMICLYVYLNIYHEFTDDFKGRLGITGYFLSHFKISEFFGVYGFHYSTFLDSGFSHYLHFSGIISALVLWVALCNLKMQSIEGDRYKTFITIYISTSLAISGDSIFALKSAGMLWFLMGSLMLTAVYKSVPTKYTQNQVLVT